ncbi:hypothetical protein B0H19DRAFT_1257064 [Mycena capillaripes]|nr:hypothetical protein B0H19DRAFT_1257064 [Mycena capillaripes]
MAILAPPDWTYSPRDPAMDKGPAQSSSSSSTNTPPTQQQRTHQLPPQQPHHPQQYPFQQQPQGTWTPSLAAPPFYPGAFYQNGPMTPQGSPQPYPTPANPYFDPANAQLAQWAYQQMMFNAQQHGHVPQQDFFGAPGMHGQFNPFPSGTPPPRPNDAPQPQYAGFHPYRRPSRQQSSHSESNAPPPQQDWRPQPPYSRPDASGSSSSVNSQGRARTNSNNSQSRGSAHSHSPSPVSSTRGSPTSSPNPVPPRIPHTRAASSSSNHSTHSASSTPASPSSGGSSASSSAAKLARPSPLSQGTVTAAALPARSPLAGPSTTPSTRAERRISRDDSSLALSSLSLLATRAEAAAASSSGAGVAKEAPVKGSGLKGRLRRALSFNASVALKEEVGADEDGAEEPDGDGDASDSDESIKASVVNPKGGAATASSKAKTPALIASATRKQPASASPLAPSAAALAASSSISPSPSSATSGAQVPMPKKKSRAASLFNSRMNVSTDNISLSSTVSSASVMIRKLGSMGRLARRNSLAGITGLFKDRKKKNGEGEEGEGEGDAEEGGEDGKKKKGKEKEDKKKAKAKAKSGKGEASEASVSHATAELEAGDWSVPDAVGLSPAAKLARQHTLKSNAEAAAKAKEAATRAAAASANTNANVNGGSANGVNGGGVPTWERNTATRSPGKRGAGVAVAEDGTHVLVEDSESEDERYGAQGQQGYNSQQQQQQQQQLQQQQHQQWDDEDDEEWGLLGGEEDDTIRVGDAYGQQEEHGYEDDGEHEPWATDIRRSVERTRMPTRGILKHAGTYDQAAYLPDAHGGHGQLNALRARSNSYNSPQGQSELGPLARMPSPDPDHIDGLHRHGSHSSAHGDSPTTGMSAKRSSVPSLPPLAFETGGSVFDSPQATPTAATYAAAAANTNANQGQTTPTPPAAASGAHAIFNHPALNSSAPALTSFSSAAYAAPVPRAATAPAKKHLAFASNLSVYDTFSASMYDRRSEPATWSRLTPALAQRIKEELNSYKMEEMEVHAASRIHTQFFV